jgi:hypothetical protein
MFVLFPSWCAREPDYLQFGEQQQHQLSSGRARNAAPAYLANVATMAKKWLLPKVVGKGCGSAAKDLAQAAPTKLATQLKN